MRIGNNKENRIINKVSIIIIVLIVIFFARDIAKYMIKRIDAFLLPIQSKVYTITKKVKDSKETVVSYKNLVDMNAELEKKLMGKILLEKKYEMLLEENIRLRELLEMKGTFSFEFKVGKINFQQSREMYESFIINIGEKNGIKSGMPVLFCENLVGYIESVSENNSLVRMITIQDGITSGRIGRNIVGVIRGNRSDELIFEPISYREAEIKLGDKVYTSGISDMYPKNIYIGEIAKIEKKHENMSQYIIKLPYNISEIDEIIVITEVGK